MSFDINQAVEAANQAMNSVQGRPLTDVEISILNGAWNRDSYDQIAAQNQYSTSYISQDIAPKLWKFLSDATGEKIKKNSLREPLKRYWESQKSHTSTSPSGSPLSTSAFLTTLLASDDDDPSRPYATYVQRPEVEALCLETLINYPGTLVRVKSPKLTGKTSFVAFVLGKLSTQGIRTVNLSLRLADHQIHFQDIDVFLRWFCFNIEQALNLESQLDTYWNAELLGSKVSCTTYFEKYLLNQGETPLVLFVDDVDLLFAYPQLYEDFFGLLRSWYEKARSRSQWKKLRLILAHSTEAYIRLNINQSPFNVGLPVELPALNREQVQELSQRFGLSYDPAQIMSLMEMLGGHPYLQEKAFDYLRNNLETSLTDFLNEAPTQAGIYRNHLKEIWHQLRSSPNLEVAFSKVIQGEHPVPLEPTSAYRLQSMGLITLADNLAQVSCQLYRQYFLNNSKTVESASSLWPETVIESGPITGW